MRFSWVTVLFLCGLFTIPLLRLIWLKIPEVSLISTPIQPEPAQTILRWQIKSTLEPIDLYVTINGALTALQAVTMLKSLLYFQGRLKSELPACSLELRRPPGIVCNRRPKPHVANPLRLHWLTSLDARVWFEDILSRWQPADMEFHLYEFESYLKYIGSIPVNHYAGISALGKLIVPYVIPTSIDKIIVVDVDTIWNHDIIDLWRQFDQFKREQAIGAVCEQVRYCPQSCPSNATYLPYFGINSGMMLMNLTELRRINWWFLWQKEVLKEINETGYLPVADQQVINQIIRQNPALYHSLPCEWNIQVHLSSGMDCCPIRWIDRLPEEDDCFEQSQVDYSDNHHTLQQARLVHHNIRQKPETSGSNALSPLEWTTSMGNMSLLQLRHRFFRVYHKFRQIPLSCFT
ncbi:hypothetical protein P879_03083 [Paragonimus westermani]|uniref:Glycosyltransferase-like protein LARGE n=1 Tax=Paragonimus westermani TaxID=34504 RepID=A0A8T0DT78_9TREM|nr:hypothetical protein P879_03083 [Paragonimus westermani]